MTATNGNGTGSLLEALLAVQAETPTLPKDKTNPHFKSKFTGLETIVQTVGPILQKHKLVWTTLPGRDETGQPALAYRLAHAPTCEALTGTMPLFLGKQDAQSMGSALTYARRYALCAVLNLVADDDDDGHAAVQRPAQASQQARPASGITPQQRADLFEAFQASGMTAVDFVELLDRVGVPPHEDVNARVDLMTPAQAREAMDALTQPRAAA